MTAYAVARRTADMSAARRLQGGENVVGGGVAAEQIHAPGDEDLLGLRVAVYDLRGGGQLLHQMPKVEQFVDGRAECRLIDGRSHSRDGPCCSRCAIARGGVGQPPTLEGAPVRRLIASTTLPLRAARYNDRVTTTSPANV